MLRALSSHLVSGSSRRALCCSSSRSVTTSGNGGDRSSSGKSATEEAADRIEQDLVHDDTKEALTQIDADRVAMPSLIKEIFVGRFNNAVMSYPDVLQKDRHQSLANRCLKAAESLREKRDLVDKIGTEKRVPKDILLALRSQGFYGLNVPVENGGEGLGLTETCRVMEELSVDMNLSETIASAANIGYKALQLFGSETMKKEHLEKFAKGHQIMALCMADSGAGCDAANSSTLAIQESDDTFALNGKKLWVTNADSADYFTVFANAMVKDHMGGLTPKLTAFMVPKSANGVTVLTDERHVMSGMEGLQCHPVEFNQVTISRDQILGEIGGGFEVLSAVLAEDRLITCARISSACRNFLSASIRHAVSRKTFGKKLIDFELIQGRLSDCAAHLFALESMIYLTAGIGDNQTDVDIELEIAACKRFATRTVKLLTDNCLPIFGSNGYLEDNVHRKYAQDLLAYQWWDSTDDILSMYLGVSSIGVAGSEKGDSVRHVRNPLLHPKQALKMIFWGQKAIDKDNFKRTLEIADYVHPTFWVEGNTLEFHVHRFSACIFQLMIQEGANSVVREVSLARLADTVVTIYATAATLARASRSVCDGYEHHEQEVMLAKLFARVSEDKLTVDFEALAKCPKTEDFDIIYDNLGQFFKSKATYPMVHPLTKYFY